MTTSKRRTVVIGILGTTLDTGRTKERWSRWRPSVAICQQPDLPVSRLELIFDPRFLPLFQTVAADIAEVSPATQVKAIPTPIQNPWDFEEVYAAIYEIARGYKFQPDEEDYLIHITTGTHVAQICLFFLTESRYFPARLLQTAPSRG